MRTFLDDLDLSNQFAAPHATAAAAAGNNKSHLTYPSTALSMATIAGYTICLNNAPVCPKTMAHSGGGDHLQEL